MASRQADMAQKFAPVKVTADAGRDSAVAGFCSHCGNPLSGSENFCNICGTPKKGVAVIKAPTGASSLVPATAAVREQPGENQEEAEEYFDQALEYQKRSQFEKALEECDKVVELAPEWGEGHNLRGAILEDLDQLEEAISEYRTAVRLDPADKDAGQNLSLALYESAKGFKGNDDEDEEDIETEGPVVTRQVPFDQNISSIIICPNCKMKIFPKPDGTCPSCQSLIIPQPGERSGRGQREAVPAASQASATVKPAPPQAAPDAERAAVTIPHTAPEDEVTRFCPNCGKPFSIADNFCKVCGTPRRGKIDEPARPTGSAPQKDEGTVPVQASKDGICSKSIRGANDGELASMLCKLDKRSSQEYNSDKTAYLATCELIKEIGRKLDDQGGEELMKKVLVRAGAIGCNTRFIEGEWDRIGTWMG